MVANAGKCWQMLACKWHRMWPCLAVRRPPGDPHVTRRQCAFRHPDGRQCGAPPLREGPLCRMHDPEYQTEVQESRRLGGIRKKREVTISGAYDLEGITTVEGIQ